MTQPVVVRGLTVRYPDAARPALDDVSFSIEPGEVVGVVGATGSGRSTLLRALLGIVPQLVPASVEGSLSIDGADPASTPVAVMAGIAALVLDDAELQLSQLTVADEVAFGLESLGTPPAEMRERVPEILERVGLAGFEERNPLTLSGGEQQRVTIACALVTRPRLLLLDDPTSSLDPRTARTTLGLATTLAAEHGTAVLVATNDADLLAEHAGRLLVLDRGRLVADGAAIERVGGGDARRGWRGRAVDRAARGPRPTGWRLRPRDRRGGRAVAGGRDVTAPDSLVRVAGAGYAYPGAAVPAVDDVSLEVGAGEVLAIAGESGSGKSTLARLIAGLVPPDTGSVMVDGLDTRHARRRDLAGRVALVFQHPNHQLLGATVHDELALGPWNLHLDPDEIARRTADAATRFGLADVLDEHPYRLGLPARRRLAIAAVLALRAPVVVLDEPTAGLDEAERDALSMIVREEAARGAAVVVVTHDLRFAGGVAGRLVVLHGGRVAADGPVDRVVADADRLAAAGLEPPPLVRLATALGLDPALAARGPGDALVAAVAARLDRTGGR